MFTVTRQLQWPDGGNVVEVSEGGLDYTNPDALGARYAGEFQEYADPREAVTAAIDIARQWRSDSRIKVSIGVGCTHGMTMPFDAGTQADAIAWAKEVWEKLPKCAGCSNPLPDDKRNYWHADDWSGQDYCSEYCAQKEAEYQAEENARIEAEETQESEAE